MLANDIAKLMAKIPLEDITSTHKGTTLVKGGIFTGHQDTTTPFGFKQFEGAEAGRGECEWIVYKEKSKYDDVFESLAGSDGKVLNAFSPLRQLHHFSRIRLLEILLYVSGCRFVGESRDAKIKITKYRAGKGRFFILKLVGTWNAFTITMSLVSC